jgi:hypothetical protein
LVTFLDESALAVNATAAANNMIIAEGCKRVINNALKAGSKKPALTRAITITYIACLSATRVVIVTPSLSIKGDIF